MGIIKQKGILDVASNPLTDADVIMTAAIVGHSYERLNSGKNIRYDFELNDDDLKRLSLKQLEDAIADIDVHTRAVNKINKALLNGGLPKEKQALIGVTPIYDQNGDSLRITGGTGDLPFDSPLRYDPKLPTGLAKDLYMMAISKPIGYQGRGAYTGFVDGRQGGQTGLMTTYRHKMPVDPGHRWIPNQQVGKLAVVGTTDDDQHKIWGMMMSNLRQHKSFPDEKPPYTSLADNGMYFQDQDTKYNPAGAPLTENDIVGYTHGMIQAVYDVVWRGRGDGTNPAWKPAGVPYEIAVGKETTKLASCFACSIFMEATGFPASSTHIGRAESWAPLYPEGSVAKNNLNNTQDQARTHCNDLWAAYCKKIIDTGIRCIAKNVEPGHADSYTKLKTFVTGKQNWDYANMILDALTVHDSEVRRVDNTLTA